jgi:acetyl-CoA synthetase (ADP-forming)
MLAAYGVALPREALARSAAEAVAASTDIGYPVVLKVVSADVAHKTEAGGVRLNLRSDDAVARAYEGIISDVRACHPTAGIEGILVAEQIGVEQELFCGMTRDPQFGPVIAFGLGGIFVEVLKDVTHGVLPLEEIDALEMIQGIRGHPVIAGARGRKPVDERALAAVILAVARLAGEHPEVRELDINPLAVATDGRLIALDCLARLSDG